MKKKIKIVLEGEIEFVKEHIPNLEYQLKERFSIMFEKHNMKMTELIVGEMEVVKEK